MKRARASDRVILALREQFLRAGWVECVQDRGQVRVATARYGPGHPRFRVVIRPGNGRPKVGEIGLVAALAGKTGYSRHIIQRALAGMPRAGALRRLSGTEASPPAERIDTPPLPAGRRGLEAIGVLDVTDRPRGGGPLPQSPDAGRESIRQAVLEALDAALSIGIIPIAAVSAAETVLQAMSANGPASPGSRG